MWNEEGEGVTPKPVRSSITEALRAKSWICEKESAATLGLAIGIS